MPQSEFSTEDLADLQLAKQLLENISFAARIANYLGYPIEKGMELLPAPVKDIIVATTNSALKSTLDFAVSTMTDGVQPSSDWLHKLSVMATGAAGGAFGLPALAIELPVSTVIMFRSIADIARSEGESVHEPEAKLACFKVFALGGLSDHDNSSETGYYAVRAALAKSLSEAAEYLAGRSMVQEAAPPLVRFLAQITTRFGIQVSEKAMAQALPIIGAAGGALINSLFIDHFQSVARGHFIVRRLERTHGQSAVESVYRNLR